MLALVYNWRSLFARPFPNGAEPDEHSESPIPEAELPAIRNSNAARSGVLSPDGVMHPSVITDVVFYVAQVGVGWTFAIPRV